MRVSFRIGGGRPPRHRMHHHHRHHHSHHHHYRRGASLGPGGTIVAGIFIFVLAAVLFFIGYRNNTRTDNFIETNGVVVDYHETWSDESGYLYAEIVKFNVNGVKYTCSSKSYSTYPKIIGSSMEVKYNPLNPKDAVAGSTSDSIFIYVVCGIVALAGIIVFFKGIKGGTDQIIESEE